MSAGDITGSSDRFEDYDRDDLLEYIDDLEARLDDRIGDAERDAEAAKRVAQRAQRQVRDVRADRSNLQSEFAEELNELRDELDELRDRTEIFKHVNDVSGMDMDTRAALCIQTVYNTAQKDPNDRGFLTVQEAWKGQGASIDRTRYYDILRRAEELVGDDDLCWFEKEERGHDPPSRLIVDLDEGRLPTQISGVRMTAGGD